MSVHEYYEYIVARYEAIGDFENAEKQIAYMKNHFDFFGIKATVWQNLSKGIFTEKGVFTGEDLKDFITLCYEDDRREMHYFAIEMLQKVLKKQDEDFILFFQYMIITNSWWDSVDWIAKLVGQHFQRFPHLILPTTEAWMASQNMWLQRVAIIFQLFYKEKTNFELMKKNILEVKYSKEFFLQKAAGWALRQHSRTDAQAVIDFVAENPDLAKLTQKEALRLILK